MTQTASQTAPGFQLQSSTGPLKLVDFRGKSRVLLYFMREFSCPLCIRNVQMLKRLHPQLKDKNVQVIVIGGGDEKAATSLAQRFQLPFPVLADPERSVYRAYSLERTLGFWQWSGTVLVDLSGNMVYRKVSQRPNASFDGEALLQLL